MRLGSRRGEAVGIQASVPRPTPRLAVVLLPSDEEAQGLWDRIAPAEAEGVTWSKERLRRAGRRSSSIEEGGFSLSIEGSTPPARLSRRWATGEHRAKLAKEGGPPPRDELQFRVFVEGAMIGAVAYELVDLIVREEGDAP